MAALSQYQPLGVSPGQRLESAKSGRHDLAHSLAMYNGLLVLTERILGTECGTD